jgi:CheY-like chemotaxis protein
MQLQVVRNSMPRDVALDNIEKLLSESISKSRHLSHELSPPVLQHSGIVAALQWQVKKASIDLRKSDSSLVICVSDQGKGFDPTILGDAKQWAGLGLVSLRERINYMGGTVEIESAPGKGCRFTLTLPFPAADAESRFASSANLAERTFSRLDNDGDKIRVLLADDHKVMRQALVKLLSSQSAIKVVGEASDGRQAVELARQLRPDIALMDISMPEMDGIEATRTIKTQIPGVRVINHQGEVLGVVEDLVANEEGKLIYLVLSKIGVTGVMAQFVAIPLDAVSPRITAQGQLSIDVDQATLDEAPAFAAGDFPDFEDGRWQQESRGYFENGETSPNDRKKRTPGMLQEGIRVVIALR